MFPYRRPSSGELDLGPASLRSETRLRTPARAYKSPGESATRYERMRAVLVGYLSPILVDSVLQRALQRHNFAPATLSDAAVSELTADIMVGLRLFVPEEKLSQLMLELAEVLEEDQP